MAVEMETTVTVNSGEVIVVEMVLVSAEEEVPLAVFAVLSELVVDVVDGAEDALVEDDLLDETEVEAEG